MRTFRLAAALIAVPALVLTQAPAPPAAPAAPPSPRADSLRAASQFDRDGSTARARDIFQHLVASAPDPASKATAERAIAISYAFDGDCAMALKYEKMVIVYWATRESAEPENAFFQEGEIANEAARICIDAGILDVADTLYRRGNALGLAEPAPKKHPASLWAFRLDHALARLAARRGDTAEAQRQVAAARRVLDGDTAMAAGQERFYPYLVGYVALHTNDLPGAQKALGQAVAMKGNENDPFMWCLLAMTYEKMGESAKAKELYQKAYDLATGHNPPAAFVRPYARKKLSG